MAEDTTLTLAQRDVIDRYHYPEPGHDIGLHDPRSPEELGLRPDVVGELEKFMRVHPDTRSKGAQRWALWRHGRLVHVSGDATDTVDVASLRKTWHAMIVGAAIYQGRIPSHDQAIGEWQEDLTGGGGDPAWRHVMTQSAGYDYPYGEYPAYAPGEMWTYSDWNLVHLCHALARVYGKQDFYDTYADVAREAYFDAIGMSGWGTKVVFDRASQMDDGVRFVISLEHMGRLGLLALARGRWNGRELVPTWFVQELETKQTYGMKVNYEGPNDGTIGLRFHKARFPECPYGYLTWVNTDGDYFPGADRRWAWGAGAGGTKIMWNHRYGMVYAAVGLDAQPAGHSVPHIIEHHIVAKNPMLGK